MAQVWDRLKKEYFTEKVFGEKWVRLATTNPLGRWFSSQTSLQRKISQGLGLYYSTEHSAKKVLPFVKEFETPLEEFVVPASGYPSFNDFFIREFKNGMRRFPENSNEMGALAEGRLTVSKITNSHSKLFVKGVSCALEEFLGGEKLPQSWNGNGWAFTFRLCPVDYHRFHFPDEGTPRDARRIRGSLLSVNPLSLEAEPKVFLKNERDLTQFESKNFGTLLISEVGAVGVAKIAQTFESAKPVKRGDQKGYFEFGGSTVILLCGPEVQPSPDILEQSELGFETLVRLGEFVAKTSDKA